jgi:hypothetical protein
MKPIHRIASLLVAAAALAISSMASGAEIVQMRFSVSRWVDGTYSAIGDGFIRYDQAVVDQQYDDWVAQCESEDGCDYSLELAFPLIDAEFEIYGHRFGADDIAWIEQYLWFDHPELIGMFVELGHFNDPYLEFIGSEDSTLDFEVNGNTTHCESARCYSYVVGEGYDDDSRFFDWGPPVPVPAYEPATLALMMLGLLGGLFVKLKPGFTRGRRSLNRAMWVIPTTSRRQLAV